jgi:hypothetical protein
MRQMVKRRNAVTMRVDLANQRVEPTGGSRYAQSVSARQWRLPPVAQAHR